MAQFSQAFLGSLTQSPLKQGMFDLGQTIGAAPGMAAQRSAEAEATKAAIQAITSNDPNQLNAVANMYAKTDPAKASQFATAAQQATVLQQEKAQLADRQESLATLAESLNLPELAKEARSTTDLVALRDIGKDIRSIQIKQLPTQSVGVRRSLAANAGITPQQFETLGLSKVSDEDFTATIAGQKGNVKAWMTENGDITAFRENDFGMVYDEEQSKFVPPGSLGLQQAPPQVQKVVNASNRVIEGIADASVKDIVDLKTKAETAKETLMVIDRQMERLGGMPTGLSANLEIGLRRVGQLVGLPYDPKVTNAQEYMMEVANLVKAQIKAFGSGTSITDADREYTERMVGGDITQQAEALERMLAIYREAAINTISTYNGAVSATAKGIGTENMGTFRPIALPDEKKKEDDGFEGFSIKG